MKILISVEQAISLIKKNVGQGITQETIALEQALGYISAEDIFAPISLPPFRQSAMDGYALNYHSGDTFDVMGEVKAGDSMSPILKKGQCVRIFTGAMVPKTANVVIKQESVLRNEDTVSVQQDIVPGSNIRPEGEQIKANELALSRGTYLNASTIGFLAGMGVVSVSVYKKPTVAIVITGNELVTGGKPLEQGQIYESNAIMLSSALQNIGINKVDILTVRDNYQDTEDILTQALDQYDFTLVSGGISVGDYDFVGRALNTIGVEQIFYKVKQKPGKPLYFGKKTKNYVFALPGNPASALSCFYVYVTLAIARFSGKPNSGVKRSQLLAENNFVKSGTRAYFLKAFAKAETVEILEGQASSMLRSFATANALVYLPEQVNSIKQGDLVEVWYLPS